MFALSDTELVNVLETLSSDFSDLSDSDNDDVCYPDTVTIVIFVIFQISNHQQQCMHEK
jgi:hypothetical protein